MPYTFNTILSSYLSAPSDYDLSIPVRTTRASKLGILHQGFLLPPFPQPWTRVQALFIHLGET
jgi:hypothetical protein